MGIVSGVCEVRGGGPGCVFDRNSTVVPYYEKVAAVDNPAKFARGLCFFELLGNIP
jgi:hypothetical protein